MLLDQRINIKFCAKLGKSTYETQQILAEAYGADTVKSQVFLSSKKVPKEDMHITSQREENAPFYFYRKGIVHF